jgi:hypothetical protein
MIIGEHDRPEANIGEETDGNTDEAQPITVWAARIIWDSQATLSQLWQTSKEINSRKMIHIKLVSCLTLLTY